MILFWAYRKITLSVDATQFLLDLWSENMDGLRGDRITRIHRNFFEKKMHLHSNGIVTRKLLLLCKWSHRKQKYWNALLKKMTNHQFMSYSEWTDSCCAKEFKIPRCITRSKKIYVGGVIFASCRSTIELYRNIKIHFLTKLQLS